VVVHLKFEECFYLEKGMQCVQFHIARELLEMCI